MFSFIIYIRHVLIQEMIFVMIQAVAPGDPNPDCPAEPNMPWMLILGGTGIGFLLLLRIAIVKCLRCIKNNQVWGTKNTIQVMQAGGDYLDDARASGALGIQARV